MSWFNRLFHGGNHHTANLHKPGPSQGPAGGRNGSLGASRVAAGGTAVPSATSAPKAAPTARLGTDRSQLTRGAASAVLPEIAALAPRAAAPTVAGLESQIQEILGPGVKFTNSGSSQWSAQDLQGLLSTVQALPASARPALANATFARVSAAPDGSTDIAQTNFEGNETLGGPLTISFTDAASQTGQVNEVAAHEFGHAVDGGGRFDPDAIREFGKLSHFLEPDGTMVNGHDQTGLEVANDPGAKPLNTSNFVQDAGTSMAQTSATEDYAESFRNYLLHPDQLMAAAPDKFLYLNAQVGKYTAGQVQTLAANNQIDLPVVMAELKNSDLRPETLAKIGQTQGLASSGDPGTAAGDVIGSVIANLANATFVSQFKAGAAQQALGPGIWNRLSQSEQSLLSQPAYASKLLATVQANQAAPADNETNGDVTGFQNLANLLLQEPSDSEKIAMLVNPSERAKYLERLIRNPQVWNNLDPTMRTLVDSPKGQDVVNHLSNNQDFVKLAGQLWGGVSVLGLFNAGPTQDPKVVAAFKANISRLGPAEVETAKTLIRSDNHNDLDTLSNGLANLGQGMDMQVDANHMM